jgi:hypothetical protein
MRLVRLLLVFFKQAHSSGLSWLRHPRSLVYYFASLALLDLVLSWTFSMENPAHIPERFLWCHQATRCVAVFELYSVLALV